MKLRREQVLLLVTAALVAFLGWSNRERARRAPSSKSAEPPELERFAVPDATLALPAAARAARRGGARDLFTPPRDTEPLLPLALERPPSLSLPALAPVPWPGLEARVMGALLRAPSGGEAKTESVPELFSGPEDVEALVEQTEADGATSSKPGSPSKPSAAVALTADERLARMEGYRKVYDWVRLGAGDPLFGRITNADRFRLSRRPKEPIQFVEVLPETGLERLPGQAPTAFERERVVEFGFAATPANWIAAKRSELDDPLPPTQLGAALDLGERCLELRLEADNALAVAAEVFALAGASSDGQLSPTARLGLAHVHEAAFRFDAAFREYTALRDKFPVDAEVRSALGALEARFHLFDSAEANLREAAKLARANWRVQLALGQFLLARGRAREALEPLGLAFAAEPGAAGDKRVRAQIRCALGRAAFAVGQLDDARVHFERALQADESYALAHAGRAAVELVAAGTGNRRASPGGTELDSGLAELAYNEALLALRAGQWVAARDGLRKALELEPLEAARALGALSYLASVTGWGEEALRLGEEAREADPTDAWIHYHLGRLDLERGELSSAAACLRAALAAQADFPDALALLAELALQQRDGEAAERYYERALLFEPQRAELHARRGWNALERGNAAAAEESLRAALASEPDSPLARAGLAWLAYARGDSAKAINALAELEDQRRNLPENEPYRAWCKRQIARIQDHESKVLWRDAFERRELKREWEVEEGAGPLVQIADGIVRLQGQFSQNGAARLLRSYEPGDFVAIEASITIDPSNNSMVGLFLSKERRRSAGSKEVNAFVAVARRKDGALAVATMDKAAAEIPWVDVPPPSDGSWWPSGRAVRLRIEKQGEGNEARGRIFVDGVPVAEGFRLSSLSAPNMKLLVGVFAEGQTGLPCRVTVDDVEIVFRQPTKPPR